MLSANHNFNIEAINLLWDLVRQVADIRDHGVLLWALMEKRGQVLFRITHLQQNCCSFPPTQNRSDAFFSKSAIGFATWSAWNSLHVLFAPLLFRFGKGLSAPKLPSFSRRSKHGVFDHCRSVWYANMSLEEQYSDHSFVRLNSDPTFSHVRRLESRMR